MYSYHKQKINGLKAEVKALKNQISVVKEGMTCKLCFRGPATWLLVPCGHCVSKLLFCFGKYTFIVD